MNCEVKIALHVLAPSLVTPLNVQVADELIPPGPATFTNVNGEPPGFCGVQVWPGAGVAGQGVVPLPGAMKLINNDGRPGATVKSMKSVAANVDPTGSAP